MHLVLSVLIGDFNTVQQDGRKQSSVNISYEPSYLYLNIKDNPDISSHNTKYFEMTYETQVRDTKYFEMT